jgi:hypothetical protein
MPQTHSIFTRLPNEPETAEYLEYLPPETLDDAEDAYSAGYTEFRFSQFTDDKGFTFPLPGLKTTQRTSFIISTSSDLPFKPGDIIRFNGNDRQKYKISSISFDRQNERYRAAFLFQPQRDAYAVKIITLV